MSGNVEADGGRQCEDQEGRQVSGRSEEVGVEVPGDGGRRREGEGGCVRGLRLPSGGMLTVNGVGVEHKTRTQKARALSSGEAEYYAMVIGCSEGLGMQLLAEDMGWKVEVWLWTDNSGSKAAGNLGGLGKLRHVELRWLWVQDVVKEV